MLPVPPPGNKEPQYEERVTGAPGGSGRYCPGGGGVIMI